MAPKKYAEVRWRVDKKNILYVYNENSLLFTKADVFEPDDDSVSEIIDEELGNDTWKYSYEHDPDDDEVDDDSDESDLEDDVDTAIGDGGDDLELPDGKGD